MTDLPKCPECGMAPSLRVSRRGMNWGADGGNTGAGHTKEKAKNLYRDFYTVISRTC